MKRRRAAALRRRRRNWTALAPLLGLSLLVFAGTGAAEDAVPVPGGPASIRRLLGLSADRPSSGFFLEVHETLLFGSPEDAGWTSVIGRRRIAAFAEDLAQWRQIFGNPATFSVSPPEEWNRAARALDWLGFEVQGAGRSFRARRRAGSVWKQNFLDALGVSTTRFLGDLRAGKTVTVAVDDESAPLPFGLAAWREMLSAPGLSPESAFLYFLKDVRASRMLVALHGLDPRTREELQAGSGARASALKSLYEKSLEPFSRHPGALRLREGRILLPGGPPADAIWTDVFGVPPSESGSFLLAFYSAGGGKAAYVADTLHHLREEQARELIFGSGGAADVSRFRRLYDAIDAGRRNYGLARRDPYDFAHLAPFWISSGKEALSPPPASPEVAVFPRDERELAELLSREENAPGHPEAALARISPSGPVASADRFSSQRRFLFLSGLIGQRPVLADPGLLLLLDRGFDRYSSAYPILEDFPFSGPELARRYLFTLDRLGRRSASRETELCSGLFQGYAVLLAEIARVGSLEAPQAEALLASLLDVPLFSRGDVSPEQGEAALFAWLSGRLVPALRIAAVPEETPNTERLLAGAMVGSSAPVPIEWRGAPYRFDPAQDEISRRRAFLARQSLTSFSELESLHRWRRAAADAASKSDLAGAKAAAAELALGLRLTEDRASSRSLDERIDREVERAREAAAALESIRDARGLPSGAEGFGPLDLVMAERHLEAVLGQVYAASAGDPGDLYYEDPTFVRRHSLRTVESGGRILRTAFTTATLVRESPGDGYRIAGSPFGLPDVLGLLHADQLPYRPGARVPTEEIRANLVSPIRRMRVALLDDDALEVVASSCAAAREFAGALAALPAPERFDAWDRFARDLVPTSRLWPLASREGEPTEEALSTILAPSDLYRVGRRLVREAPSDVAALPAARRAAEALARLEKRRGSAGARARLAEFGPYVEAYAGRPRLDDIDMPPYERLAVYRRPQMFGERLYDLKISVACRVAEAGLPAFVLPIVLPAALDGMLETLAMAHPYDWRAAARAASAFSRTDLERIMDEAVRSGRLVRESEAAP